MIYPEFIQDYSEKGPNQLQANVCSDKMGHINYKLFCLAAFRAKNVTQKQNVQAARSLCGVQSFALQNNLCSCFSYL